MCDDAVSARRVCVCVMARVYAHTPTSRSSSERARLRRLDRPKERLAEER